jgi:phage terminase small subunit
VTDAKLSMTPADLATYRGEHDAKPGPAVAALPERMQRFVLALVQTGCSRAEAARLAGYAGNANTLKSKGYALSHDPRVQAALHEESLKLMRDTAPMAIGVLKEVAQDRTIDPKARIKAAAELLSRSGLGAMTEHKVTVERQLDQQALIAEIANLARSLDLDPVKLLGHVRVADLPPPFVEPIEAEFTEVTTSDHIPADLKDIL